ncbi:hypothetical protein HYU96_01400 [Candidatus Daviesbacteria bacterium]|nr:hypothetical protein [Candidatus Daviesbacteria bacterium]
MDKFSYTQQQDLVFDLINAFALANKPLDAALFIQDLLTEDEVKILAKRLRIAKFLLTGYKHEDIVSELHCSFATVTKVRIWLDNAGDGLKKVIRRLPERKQVSIPRKTPGVGYGLPDILAYYLSSASKKKEDKNLKKFLVSMKEKNAIDRELKEEINEDFRKLKKRKG